MNQTTVIKVIVMMMIWQLRFEPVHVFDCVWRFGDTWGKGTSAGNIWITELTCCGRARPWVWGRAWCMLGRGTRARWLAAEWACRLDICSLRSGTFSDRLWWIINIVTVQRAVRSLTVSRLKGYIQSNSIMKLVLALKANAIPRRSRTKPTSVLYRKQEKKKKTTGLTNMKCTKY